MEVCLGVQPFPQPSPAKNPGGDCFACALTAALRHLFPERPIDFEDAWKLFLDPPTGHLSNTWFGMRSALYRAFNLDYRTEIASDLVEPRFDIETWSHAWWSSFPSTRYAHRLEGWLRGGWVALTEIDYSGGGPMTPDGKLRGTNHFVLLDGIRTVWEPWGDGNGASRNSYVHVVCSARGPYWIGLVEFLHKYGGAGWWLCRRDERDS